MNDYTIKSIRKDFKDKGVFYTPPELALYMKSLLPNDITEIYDPTCGRGNLLSVFPDDVKKYGQDINNEELEIASNRLINFEGQCGDTLMQPAFTYKKFKYIIANPPFSIKWTPYIDDRFKDVPVLPPPSKADYAFILHILHYLSDDGKAVVMGFPGILYRGQREGQIRKWLIEKNVIEKVISIQGKKFEDTSIPTCIIVFNKSKTTKDVIFVDDEHQKERVVSVEEIEKNNYTLSANIYIPIDKPKETLNPLETEMQCRKNALRKLEAELNTSKMICEFENLNFKEFVNDIYKLLEKYKGE